jgi:Spy/CpxP family protein refolding chaperone
VKKRILIITLTLAALAAVPILYAGPGGRALRGMHGGMHGHGAGMRGLAFLGILEHAKEELDLSDAQVAEIKAIARATHDENLQYRDQIHGTLKQVATKLLANPNDIAGAQAALDQQLAAEKAIKSSLLVGASKALNVLTPEQRTKLALHLAERANRWENHGR